MPINRDEAVERRTRVAGLLRNLRDETVISQEHRRVASVARAEQSANARATITNSHTRLRKLARAGADFAFYAWSPVMNTKGTMSDAITNEREANAIDEGMAQQMRCRRLERPERKRAMAARPVERRQVCGYCFHYGDHRTPSACLRALEK